MDPVLVITGGADTSVDNEQTKHFFGAISSKDKELHDIPDTSHYHMFLDGEY